METVDIVGHAFYMVIFFGQALISRQTRCGWMIRMFGDVGWAALGCVLGLTSVMLWASIFAVQDFRGWKLWSHSNKDRHEAPRPKKSGILWAGFRFKGPASPQPDDDPCH